MARTLNHRERWTSDLRPDDEGLGNIRPEDAGLDPDDEGLGNIRPEDAGLDL